MGLLTKKIETDDLECICGNRWLVKCYKIAAKKGESTRFFTTIGAENIKFYCPNCNSMWLQSELLRHMDEA